MNKQMIEKINKINNNVCPEFAFDNPLLDRNVTNALSKSFIKILDVLKNPNSNSNLRFSVLEIIRKSCQTEPKDHIKVDENLTEIISQFYCSDLKQKTELEAQEKVEKTLDAFLLRRIENCEVSAKYESKLNLEVIQSLINLKQDGVYDILSKDVINWNVKDSKQTCILKEMFLNNQITDERKLLDDIFIKMSPEIEKYFLELAHRLIESTIEIETFFDNLKIKRLIKTCAISPKGFQICCAILNFIFITSNYNSNIQSFIVMFVNHIKSNITNYSFHSLYPIHLNHIVLLLDLNDEDLSYSLRNIFVKETLKYLKFLHNNDESSLIMLLCHFPRWFDIYFDSEHCRN